MEKCKFKVGDKIKPTKDNTYEITGKEMKLGIVTDVGSIGDIRVKVLRHNIRALEGKEFPVQQRFFEKVNEETIVIYRKDNEVIALDKSTEKKAEARCNPADEFDFHTGAKLAFSRLMSEKESEFEPHLVSDYLENEVINLGRIGDETDICDIAGRKLSVGDTVNVYTVESHGEFKFYGERSVVKEHDVEFVMGLKGVQFDNGVYNEKQWFIALNRRHTEVDDGETVDCIKYIKSERAGK